MRCKKQCRPSFCIKRTTVQRATVPYKGRVHKLKPDQAETLRQAWKEGKYPSKVALANAFGISRQAVYRYLQRE